MRRRLPLFALLASASAFLASLYLLWIESKLNAFYGGAALYGWAGRIDRLPGEY